jgi:hypothetical protein
MVQQLTPPGISLSLLKFRKIMEIEITTYWYYRTSFEYSVRWWNSIPVEEKPETICKYPGDMTVPFKHIDITPENYINMQNDVLASIRGNKIINIVTAFETYLYDVLKRAIFIKPDIIKNSEMEFNAKLLSKGLKSENFKEWLSEHMVSKYIRNESHKSMIEKIDRMILGGIVNGQSELIKEWVKITTLRNTLVHRGREVSPELSKAWQEKFPDSEVPIILDDDDIVKTHSVASNLANKIDKQAIRTTIGFNDAKLLSRVLFLKDRNQSESNISMRVSKLLKCGFDKNLATSSIAYQKRTRERIAGFEFTAALIM